MEGVDDGSSDDTVGPDVGELVGSGVSASVGCDVGECVGTQVCVTDGDGVGSDVSVTVGSHVTSITDGFDDRAEVGSDVVRDGILVALIVG